MKPNLTYDFVVNKENNTITINREFAADRPLVWDAFTKPEILDQWWAPKPWKARTKTMDFKEGGQWHYAMVGPEGEEHWSLVKYSAIAPQKMFAGNDVFADADANVNTELPQSKWKVSFTDQGQHTLVVFNISFDDLQQLEGMIEMGFKEGITMTMESLDELLPKLKK